MSQTIVIKIGGVASQHLSSDFINQVKQWKEQGNKIIIVYGGGFAINQLMEENQVTIKKINGLRVTSHSDMKLVERALLDIVGKNLVDKFLQYDLDGIQLRQMIQKVVTASFLDKELYGYVGEVSSISPTYLNQILSDGMIPLIASLGYSKEGQLLNINADYLATAIANSLKADKLILMTDVKGVLENNEVLDSLSINQVKEKIDCGIITGGMIPKIESAANTVLSGVNEVLIGDNLLTGTSIIQ